MWLQIYSKRKKRSKYIFFKYTDKFVIHYSIMREKNYISQIDIICFI